MLPNEFITLVQSGHKKFHYEPSKEEKAAKIVPFDFDAEEHGTIPQIRIRKIGTRMWRVLLDEHIIEEWCENVTAIQPTGNDLLDLIDEVTL